MRVSAPGYPGRRPGGGRCYSIGCGCKIAGGREGATLDRWKEVSNGCSLWIKMPEATNRDDAKEMKKKS